MAQGNPLPGEKYLHFKNKLYQVIAVANHSETMEPYVVYQALYGDFGIYIRPYDMFISEVDHEKYPEVTQKYRFSYVEQGMTIANKADYNQPEVNAGDSLRESVERTSYAENSVVTGAEDDAKGSMNAEEKQDMLSNATSHAGKNDFNRVNKDALDSETESMYADGEDGMVNPWLLKFLDADSMEQKYQIVCDIKNDITDRLIDDLAVVVDVVIPEGKLGDRYEQLKYCIRTRQKYEQTSLRRK